MRLYLVRHGQALDENKDKSRHLNAKGKLDAQKTAEFLKRANITLDAIFTSKKTRAIQTAEIFRSQLMNSGKVQQIDGISPNDSAIAFLENTEFEHNNIMLVGHLPFLSHLTSLLLTQEANIIKIAYLTSSVVCLEQKGRDGWQLAFSINPDLILKSG